MMQEYVDPLGNTALLLLVKCFFAVVKFYVIVGNTSVLISVVTVLLQEFVLSLQERPGKPPPLHAQFHLQPLTSSSIQHRTMTKAKVIRIPMDCGPLFWVPGKAS